MQKRYFIAICLILFTISMAAVSASDIEQTDSDTDIIAVSNDNVLRDSVDSGTFDDLQGMINNASEGSTVELTNNYTYDDTFQADGILINKSLTIEGNGFTIDGANQARIFFINATNNITLNNIVFANAISSEGGAILFNQEISNVTISNSVFTNNSLSIEGSGGGAVNFKSDASLVLFENNTFENNYAPLGYGGNVVFVGNATLVVFNGCDFREDKPRENNGTRSGGGIYFIKDTTMAIINNCEFDNLTTRAGGAIFVEGDFALSLINNTKFTNNKAYTNNTAYGGGAISIEGEAGLTAINNCTFINNTATTHGGAIKLMGHTEGLFINSTIFDGNYAPYAGALCLQGTDGLIITDSKFTNNKGTGADIVGGGAIYVIGNLTDSYMERTLFKNNSARTGGAIFVEGNMNHTTFNKVDFINNSAFTNNTKYGGGAIAVQGNATNNQFNNLIFEENTATTHGGAIKFMENDENNTFNKIMFYDNYAPYGGSIAVQGNSTNLNLTRTYFMNYEKEEKGVIGGGAIYFINNADGLLIDNCGFYDLTSHTGGAIYVEGDLSTAIINATGFKYNKATTNNTKYGGGAIAVEGNTESIIITESNFIGNTATTHGGAIKLMGNNTYIAIGKTTFDENYAPYAGAVCLGNTEALVIHESNFTNNKGTDADIVGGGAIYVIGNLTYAYIESTIFENNSARAGGAIYVEGNLDESTFENTYFINNTAFTNNTKYGGGAIAVQGNATNNLFDTSTFVANTATTHGGAIKFMENDNYNTFYTCTFLNNYAPYGGSIAVQGSSTRLNLTDCIFENYAEDEAPLEVIGGGALYFINNATALFINNSAFYALTARAGGAIFVEKDLNIAMINSTDFIDNKATTNNTKYGGGAIAVQGNTKTMIIIGSNFINNTATTHGGAIKLMGNNSLTTIVSSTFNGNYAPYGGAICLGNTESLIVEESDFINNKGTDADIRGGGAIYVIGNLTQTRVADTIFENNSARAGGAIYVEGNMAQSTFEETIFTNNSAFTNNTKYGGGAIAVQGNATNNQFNNVIFEENTATTHGGAIKFMENDENNTFDTCAFYDNYAPYGGSIAVQGNSTNLNLTRTFFTNSKEDEKEIIGGGAIYFINNADELLIDNCGFYTLTARTGGAIYIEKDLSATIINATDFKYNKATTNNTKYGGGAIAVQGNTESIIIIESNFTGNTATTHGGAIKLMGNNTGIAIGTTTFDENYAPYGGAICLGNTVGLIIHESNFTNNKGTDADIIGGGAIYVIGNLTHAYIEGTLFQNNSARAGGAIYVEGNLDKSKFENNFFFNNTAFTNNTKYGGGAIAVQGDATNNLFNESIFVLNTGTTHGGVINFMANAINNTFVECGFVDNNAKYGASIAVNGNTENLNIIRSSFAMYNEPAEEIIGGGALYFVNNVSNLYINETNFNFNIARAGGAIYIEKTIENSAIENTLFEKNIITTENEEYGGGAISVEGAALGLAIEKCEFISNIAVIMGGAIFINNAEDVLIDDVLFSDNGAEIGKSIFFNDGANVTIQNCDFIKNEGNGGDIYYAGDIVASIINSTFDGETHIIVGKYAELTLSNNNEINPYSLYDYFVYNEGTLTLENNTLSNVIYNNGIITSPTTMTTLFNMTFNTTDSHLYLSAICADDNDNIIKSDYGTFYVNDYGFNEFYNDEIVLTGDIDLIGYGSYLINAETSGALLNCTYEYAIVNYIPKKDSIINASDIEIDVGEYGEIEVELPENATGIVTASIDNETYMAAVKDGKATIIIPHLEAGEYEATITYSGDDEYEGNYTTISVTVLDKISVEAPDVTKYYHGSERFVVNVTQSGKPVANATVEITINGATYTRQTDENGTASIGLNLGSGNYTAAVKVDGTTAHSTITVLPTVNGTDVTKVFRNGTQYYATFLDSEGNYLKEGTTVTFNINGVFYERKITGNKGLAKLNINLEQGEYIITAINPNTTEQASNTVIVISRIVDNHDITKYYRNATQYTATILGDDGEPVGAGATVRFNINGVFYERITNETGQVKLNLNLQPGDYIITAEYNGCMVSNNVKILPVLSAEDLTKQYGTPDPFEAKLVDGQGNPYANKKIEFNINGVFYYRTTDSSGIARLNINLQAGEYIITSTYDSYSVSNKITIIA